MNKCELFKRISEIVWDCICSNHRRGNRLNEEGISRQIIISKIQDVVEQSRAFDVFAQKAINEVNTGSDIELYIDNGEQLFFRILLQAKLMELDCCFEHLDRNSGSTGRKQYDSLKSFANQADCDAYYLMYNGCPGYTTVGNDCAGNFNEKQFGCAVLTPDQIKNHCEINSTGKLGSASNVKPNGRPWRTLACCDYGYLNGNKLYSINEIDMDDHFQKIFTPPNIIGYITPNQLYEEQIVANNNNIIHDNGWEPSARIIVSSKKMRKNGEILEF